jgi:hypothetical protein
MRSAVGDMPRVRSRHASDVVALRAVDHVVATGKTHKVREFWDVAFSELGLDSRQQLKLTRACIARPKRTLWWATPPKFAKILNWAPTRDFKIWFGTW